MKKKLLAIILALALVFSLAALALAEGGAEGQKIYLKGNSNNFNENWNNVFYIGGAETAKDPQIWHLVYSADVCKVSYMQLTFTNGNVFEWRPEMDFSTNGGGNNPGWVIAAPYDWELDYIDKGNNDNESDCYVIATNGGQFNVSGYHKGSADPADPGNPGIHDEPSCLLDIWKTVDGEPIATWSINGDYNLEEILDGMEFYLYKSNEHGDKVNCLDGPAGLVEVDGNFGKIDFKRQVTKGWYLVEEELSGIAAEIFEEVSPMLIYCDGESITGNVPGFGYENKFTIINGYGSGYVLGYPGLNNTGDIFPIGVTDTETGEKYPSFCANAGSRAFAGESGLDCSGYMVTFKGDIPFNFADFLSAYNYIEDNYGDLDDNRVITQIVTWYLLGAIEIPSDKFETINWVAVEAGTWDVNGIPNAKVRVEDIIANYKDYAGEGNIVDIVYLTCEHGHNSYDCQPQLVPLYGDKRTFNNKTRPNIPDGSGIEIFASAIEESSWQKWWEIWQGEKTPYKVLSAKTDSTTLTNAGYKGDPSFKMDNKNNSLYDKVVPGSNHFCYAVLDKAALEAGKEIELALVNGNKIDQVGSATVKMVGDKLEVKINDLYSGTYGFVAADGFLPYTKNGNIHSLGIFKTGSSFVVDILNKDSYQDKDKKGEKYDKDWSDIIGNKAAVKDENCIYLYMHANPIQFDYTAHEPIFKDGYAWEIIAPRKIGIGESEIKDTYKNLNVYITILDVSGEVVKDGEFTLADNGKIVALEPGTYMIEWYIEGYEGNVKSEEVEVVEGEFTEFSIHKTIVNPLVRIRLHKVFADPLFKINPAITRTVIYKF